MVVTTADNFELVGDVPETVTVGQCAPGAISVDKDASVSSVTAPGGDVTYTVTVTNTSSPSQGVTITKIDDDKFGVIWERPLIREWLLRIRRVTLSWVLMAGIWLRLPIRSRAPLLVR